MARQKSEGFANIHIYRFSERCFRKYEQVYVKIMGDFAKPFIFNLPGSPETHLCRLRDSARSLIQNRFLVDFDIDLFAQLWDHCCVSQPKHGEGVLIYDKENPNHFQRDDIELDPEVNDELALQDLLIDGATNDEIEAMLILTNNNKLAGKNFKIRNLTVPQQQYLRLREADFPNAVVDQVDPETFIII